MRFTQYSLYTRGRPCHPSRCRFIPAGAGNTDTSGVGSVTGTVHPRGCGEPDGWISILPKAP
jgi:hypothetical protein